MSKIQIIVTENTGTGGDAALIPTVEIFRQSFDATDFDLRRFVSRLNKPTRAKRAKKASQP